MSNQLPSFWGQGPDNGFRLVANTPAGGQSLCPTCSKLDLDRVLSMPQSTSVRYSQYTQFKFFAWENSTHWSRSCPLCAIFRQASGNHDHDIRTPYALRMVARSLMNAHDWGTPEIDHVVVKRAGDPVELDRETLRNRELGLLYLAVTKDHEQDECSTAELTADVRLNGMISWCYTDGRGNQGRGRVLDHRQADVASIRNWLGYCEKHHRQCRIQGTRGAVDHFQLIDCTTDSIVVAPIESEYVALSYVWGRGQPSGTDVLGRKLLVDRLPKTVSDAILATRQLGIQYLWVDRYCIPDDPRIKHAQISRMDIIYQNACATLIAAGGDASHGLPGIGNVRRTKKTSVQLGNITMFTTLPHPHTLIKRSSWMTRGWTYQEAILSRRRIFFTDEQVYFECNGMQCLEALPPALDDWHTDDKSSFLSLVDRSIFTVPTSSVGLTSLWLFTSDYAQRKLSFRCWWGLPFTTEFDLHSRPFAGDYVRLTRVRAHHGDAFHEAQLPGREEAETTIEPQPSNPPEDKSWSPEHCFMNSLLWTHSRDNNKRRSDFPSWTWVGWEGPVSKLPSISNYYGCTCDPNQRVPRIIVSLLSSRRVPLTPQPRDIFLEAITVPVKVVKISNPRDKNRLMRDGYYIARDLGNVALRDVRIYDCTVFARLNLDSESEAMEQKPENDAIGCMGIVLGCGGNIGLLVVKPAKGGGCQRLGVVNISHGSEFQGELAEITTLMADGESCPLMKHWYSGSTYSSANCWVGDIGRIVAVSPKDTTIKDWKFDEMVLQSILR
ncbi:putative HET-domain-containing protein [Seiridium cardinale]|uniref:HET-domain-containing protein n=1 Tax=Seiridium cardinale TaxID=138064 RepID=A0ABR2XE82_9PEZI